MRRTLAALALTAAFLPVLAAARLPAGAASTPPPARAPRPDVVLVTLDTFRWDAAGFSGGSPRFPRTGASATPSPTPVLDRLAAAGRVFTDAHAHSVVTLPSHTNLLTGLYPNQHGVRDNAGFRVPAAIPTLATVLHDAGYATGAFVGAYPLDSTFGLDRGFDVYDDRYPKGNAASEFAMPERRGDEVVKRARAWWNASGAKPRFLWVHLYDAHAPYLPPEPFASRYRETPYLGEIAAVDSYLAPLLEPFLAGKERAALIVVTADHGEALGDHGEATHGLFAYEATLKVPLVVWGAGVPRGRDDRAARHVDVFPTVLAATGVALPKDAGGALARPGRSLLAPAAPDVSSYFEALSAALNRGWAPLRGVIDGGRKLVALPLPELYDLRADPGETRNLVDADRPSARKLAARLPPESADAAAAARTAPTGEEAARLRALGYAVAGAGSPAGAKASFGPADDPKKLLPLDAKISATLAAYDEGRLDAAISGARALVAARPSMAMAHSLLAQALLEAGRTGEALDAMQAARAKDVASDSLRLQLGLTLTETGRARDALAVLAPLADAGVPRALDALGLALAAAGRPADAEAALRRALAADPEDPRAHENLALLALQAGRWTDARDASKRALDLDPALPNAWNDLGAALYGLGDKAGAVGAWRHAVDLDGRQWDALWNLGTTSAELGRREDAVRALRAFVAGAPRERYAEDVERARGMLARLGDGG